MRQLLINSVRRTAAHHLQEQAETEHVFSEAQAKLLEALMAFCEPSGRATVDLAEIALRLRLRDLTWRIALLGLRLAGRVHVEHDAARFETATVTLTGGRD